MQYNKRKDGSFTPLTRRCVDTGMGIERTVTMMQGKKSVYDTEIFQPVLKAVGALASVVYGENEENDISLRIIADHVRTASFILGDDRGVKPSNVGQGYILRRLIRRAVRHGRKLGIDTDFLAVPAQIVIDMYRGPYPEMGRNATVILEELRKEEERFRQTLTKGLQEFEKLVPNLLKNPQKTIPGRVVFRLYDTFGFPAEMTAELAAEHGLTVDREGFEAAFKKHQELSKQGAEKAFKGGLADHSEMTTALHTATHLLHKALHIVLGAERLRFDFTHPEKMTDEQIARVEELVNDAIRRDLPVTMEVMPLEKAKDEGAYAFFGDKYDADVKVYTIGDFSKEVCGGPHVSRTGTMGHFKIQKEQSSSSGVRRIRAVLEK